MLMASVGNACISSAVLGLGELHTGIKYLLLEGSAFCSVILDLPMDSFH